MEKEWSEMTPDEKREERFKRWLSPENTVFVSPEAEKLYKERVTRFIDAINLKEPDRVPVLQSAGNAPARYYGYTIKDVMYDSGKVVEAWTKYMENFELDSIPTPNVRCGEMWDLLKPKMYKWAGGGLADDCSPQFVELEFLKGDEWDSFMENPSDFHLRTFLPRSYHVAEPLKKLPPVQSIGGFGAGFSAFDDPEIQSVLSLFSKAGKLEKQWRSVISGVERKAREMGIPPFYVLSRGGVPMDTIGAALRGTVGTINDMFRQPEKLIEYIESEMPNGIKAAVDIADITGIPIVYMPLHRGADGFMNEKQFLKFYWPYLKRVVEGCAEEGVIPVLFAEGAYNSRLEIVKDLPPGKAIWHFDQTDIKKAKEILGNNTCIMGNVPISLMVTGTPDEVKKYCRTLIETAGRDGGYVLAPGAASDDVKVENVQAMLEAAKEYGVYST
ncbi:uroporphyrinogen decarboxylase family protein [Thermodesulfobacteriota bacterium]